jgi:ABC-type proline/glycine betaine transport system ATPase subunit
VSFREAKDSELVLLELLRLIRRCCCMDEPLGALDPLTRVEIHREFHRIQAQLRKTIVCVTHDMREAFALGTRMGVIVDGQLAAFATPDEINNSTHHDVRLFLDAMDFSKEGRTNQERH